MSLKFVRVPSLATHTVRLATASLRRWYHMQVCFFSNVESGIEAFLKTALLSQNMFVGQSRGRQTCTIYTAVTLPAQPLSSLR